MICPSTHLSLSLSLSFVGLTHFTYTSTPPPLLSHRCCYFCYLHNTTSLIFYTDRITSRCRVKYIYHNCRNNAPTQFTCGRAIVLHHCHRSAKLLQHLIVICNRGGQLGDNAIIRTISVPSNHNYLQVSHSSTDFVISPPSNSRKNC